MFEVQGWEDGKGNGRREVRDEEVEAEREKGVQRAGFVVLFPFVIFG